MSKHAYYLEYDQPINAFEECGLPTEGNYAIHMEWLLYDHLFLAKDDTSAGHYALRFLTKSLWLTEKGVIRARRLRTLISRETGRSVPFRWDVYYQKIQAMKDAYYRAKHST